MTCIFSLYREELIAQLQDQIQLLDEDGAQLREQVGRFYFYETNSISLISNQYYLIYILFKKIIYMWWWWSTYLSTQYHRIRVTGYLIAHTWKYNFLDLNMIVLSKHSFLAFFLKSLKSDGHGTMYLTMVILKSQKLCLILSLWESFGREVWKSCFWVHVAFYILNSESLLAKSKK